MKPPADYRVLVDLQVPGSYAFAYRAGDEMSELNRQAFGRPLVVGLDIAPLRADVLGEPDSDDRPAWQDYAVSVGVPYDEAVNLDLKDLKSSAKKAAADEAKQAEVAMAAGQPVAMPEESAVKAEWINFAASELVQVGADPEFAKQYASDHTKADLIAAVGPEADADARGKFFADAGDAEGSQPVAQQG